MKNDNRVCICCGTSYKYCNTCAEYANLPQWMNIYDKIECKVIFDVVTDYLANKITKDEAKEQLSNYDMTNISIKASIRKVIDEILDKHTNKKMTEEVIEHNVQKETELVENKEKVESSEKKHIFNNKKK